MLYKKQKKRGIFLKTFFGSVFIEKEKLEEAGITHPIKLEYYKQINEDEINSYEKPKYGIHIIKTEYEPNYTKVENKSIKTLKGHNRKYRNYSGPICIRKTNRRACT